MLRLKNTLTRKLEEFKPLEHGSVRIYACGPTVYGNIHIGNFRTFVAVDVLQRYLKYLGYKVRYAMNITDVDDKIIRGLKQSGKSLEEYTGFYTSQFLEDLDRLNIQMPDVLPRATARSITGSRRFLSTESYRVQSLKGINQAPGSTSMSTTRPTQGISCCGR